jgi:beta-lactamase regulating signal transducer with metallopeptidase domain
MMEKAVTTSSATGPISIRPELLSITLLAVGGFAPLVLSSGVELFDWFFTHDIGTPLPRLDPLVGMDAWLHGLARIMVAVGVAHVLVRRVGPFLSFRRRMGRLAIRTPDQDTELYRIAVRNHCLAAVRVLPASYGAVAFTAGIVRPRIYLSELLMEELDDHELELVLLHEIRHCRAYDPARSFFATILADFFFWLPAVRKLEERVMAKIEFAADEAAASLDRIGLAQTILKVASLGTRPMGVGAVAFARAHGIRARVHRLIRVEDAPVADRHARRTVVRSTIAVMLALWTLGFTAYGTHHAHQDEGPNGHGELAHPSEVITLPTPAVADQPLADAAPPPAQHLAIR